MINIFKKNDVVNIFLLLPYTIILRLYSLIHPTAYQVTELDPIWLGWFFDLVNSPIIQSVIAILLIFAQAVVINLLGNRHHIFRMPSALGGMFYIIMISAIPELQVLSPALIGVSFLLASIYNVFNTYKQTIAASSIFNAALFSAIAAIIYPPFVIAMISIFIGLSMMRNFKAVERIQFVIGFGVMIWIVGVLFFYYDLFDSSTFFDNIVPLGLISEIDFKDSKTLWVAGVSSFLILLSFGNYYSYVKKKGIDVRKKIGFFYWLLVSALLALLIFKFIDYQHFYYLALSLALFVSMAVLLIKNTALSELIHLFLLGGIYYYQFGSPSDLFSLGF